jgi:hypothetical protein
MPSNYIAEIEAAVRREELRRLLAAVTRMERVAGELRRDCLRRIALSYAKDRFIGTDTNGSGTV